MSGNNQNSTDSLRSTDMEETDGVMSAGEASSANSMAASEGEMEGEDFKREKRLRNDNRSSRKTSSFRMSRRSFIDPLSIKQQEAMKLPENRVSMRRISRAYSIDAPSDDLTHPRSRITIEWKDLGYLTQPKRNLKDWVLRKPASEPQELLKGLTGILRHGELMGIMGPSGSGKSVFINVLTGWGLTGKVSGEILVNGQHRNEKWRHVVAFVEQDTGYLDARLTVSELMNYYARLTIPERYGEEERQLRIQHAMRMMSIETIAGSTIGGEGVKGISGGERKRLAIALELLQEPKVLLLDEPTSGLDAKTAADLVKFLYHLAVSDDMTIVMTVHQPRMSIVSKFDRLMILAGGETVFFGTVDDAIDFYAENGFICPEHENPAEYFLQVMHRPDSEEHEGETPDNAAVLKEAWTRKQAAGLNRMSHFSVPPVNESANDYKLIKYDLPPWREIPIVAKRFLRVVTRDKSFYLTANVLIVTLGVLSMFVFFQIPDEGFQAVQNRLGVPLGLIYNTTGIAILTALIHQSKYAVMRERYRSLARASSYYWAFILVQFPLWICTAMLVTTAAYYVVGLRYTPFTALLIFLSFALLISIQALTIAVLFATGTESIRIAFTMGVFYFVIENLFNGTNVNTNNITWVLRWIRYISPMFYTYSGMIQNEFNGQTLNGEPGEYWMQLYGLNVVSVMWAAGALMIITAASLLGGMIVFRIKTPLRLYLFRIASILSVALLPGITSAAFNSGAYLQRAIGEGQRVPDQRGMGNEPSYYSKEYVNPDVYRSRALRRAREIREPLDASTAYHNTGFAVVDKDGNRMPVMNYQKSLASLPQTQQENVQKGVGSVPTTPAVEPVFLEASTPQSYYSEEYVNPDVYRSRALRKAWQQPQATASVMVADADGEMQPMMNFQETMAYFANLNRS